MMCSSEKGNFFSNIGGFGDRVALLSEEKQLTYRQLQAEIDKLRAAFAYGRCLAFCVCTNATASVVGYLALLQAGIVPVLINDTLSAELYAHLRDQYRPQLVWAPEGFTDAAGAVYRSDGYTLIQTGHTDIPTLDDRLALLLTTSGSTGSPKLVRQSYQNLYSNTAAIVEYLHIAAEDRAITTLPMSYTYGLSILQTHLCAGASIILCPYPMTDRKFWNALRDQEATTFGGVPYTYELLKQLRFTRMDLPSLRYLTQAGGKLDPALQLELATFCRDKGKAFVVMYGQTEATARMGYLPPDMAIEKVGSMGIAIPGGRFSLIDVDGQPVEESGVTGELVYRGDNVAMGYSERREDLALGDVWGGVLETGDMAKRDTNGYYYIVGRKKRFLKMFGNRINLFELENLLRDGGYECALTGVDDHMAIFTTNEDTKAVHTMASNITGLHKSGFTVRQIAEIPRNEAGKVLYARLETDNADEL